MEEKYGIREEGFCLVKKSLFNRGGFDLVENMVRGIISFLAVCY